MSLVLIKEQLNSLLSATVEAALRSERKLEHLRGVAYFDGEKDTFIVSLEPFGLIEEMIKALEPVQKYYGVHEARRITLQLIYEYFWRSSVISIDSELIERLWDDFVTELNIPYWTTRAVTNLRYFHFNENKIDLGDNVSVLGRNQAVLKGLGFSTIIWDGLVSDWTTSGPSSFVLVSETRIQKESDNIIHPLNLEVSTKCVRALGALRMIGSGDIGISAIFVQRVARFNFGISGLLISGSTVNTFGNIYELRKERVPMYQEMYKALARLEKIGYKKSPGNLDLALFAFMSTYDRYPTRWDTKLVDAITALEAILGNDNEIAFKLSFRVSSLLAGTDEQRSKLLKRLKEFYDTRSKIVHGKNLMPKQNETLKAVDELRDIVRTLLASLVFFAAGDEDPTEDMDFKNKVDEILVDTGRRERLRALLKLT